MAITSFKGEYRWLSNFHMIDVEYQGIVYPSTEAAYQAAKTDIEDERLEIRNARSPGLAQRLGQKVTIRPTWDTEKLKVMLELTRQKFKNPHLRDKLLITGKQHLIEFAPWGDKFWGVCGGDGENHLGRILMDIRAEIIATL